MNLVYFTISESDLNLSKLTEKILAASEKWPEIICAKIEQKINSPQILQNFPNILTNEGKNMNELSQIIMKSEISGQYKMYMKMTDIDNNNKEFWICVYDEIYEKIPSYIQLINYSIREKRYPVLFIWNPIKTAKSTQFIEPNSLETEFSLTKTETNQNNEQLEKIHKELSEKNNKADEVDFWICPKCDEINKLTATYCKKCFDLGITKQNIENLMAKKDKMSPKNEEKYVEESKEINRKWICKDCGTQNSLPDYICIKCGYRDYKIFEIFLREKYPLRSEISKTPAVKSNKINESAYETPSKIYQLSENKAQTRKKQEQKTFICEYCNKLNENTPYDFCINCLRDHKEQAIKRPEKIDTRPSFKTPQSLRERYSRVNESERKVSSIKFKKCKFCNLQTTLKTCYKCGRPVY